jgi:hypothetical protein
VDGLSVVLFIRVEGIVILGIGSLCGILPPPLAVTEDHKELPRKRSDDENIVIRKSHASWQMSLQCGRLHLIKPKREPEWVPPQDVAATQIVLRANDVPEDFPGQRMAMCASIEEVEPTSLEFSLAWSKAETEKGKRRRWDHAPPWPRGQPRRRQR